MEPRWPGGWARRPRNWARSFRACRSSPRRIWGFSRNHTQARQTADAVAQPESRNVTKTHEPVPGGSCGRCGSGTDLRFGNGWDTGLGGSYRSYVFRLADAGPAGIGENNFVARFLRLSRQLGKGTQIDLYAAALTNGKLTVKNASGNDLTNDAYKTAPAIGLTFQTHF
jgi:hypothetical protein